MTRLRHTPEGLRIAIGSSIIETFQELVDLSRARREAQRLIHHDFVLICEPGMDICDLLAQWEGYAGRRPGFRARKDAAALLSYYQDAHSELQRRVVEAYLRILQLATIAEKNGCPSALDYRSAAGVLASTISGAPLYEDGSGLPMDAPARMPFGPVTDGGESLTYAQVTELLDAMIAQSKETP